MKLVTLVPGSEHKTTALQILSDIISESMAICWEIGTTVNSIIVLFIVKNFRTIIY
jgi:hypothetical protein